MRPFTCSDNYAITNAVVEATLSRICSRGNRELTEEKRKFEKSGGGKIKKPASSAADGLANLMASMNSLDESLPYSFSGSGYRMNIFRSNSPK